MAEQQKCGASKRDWTGPWLRPAEFSTVGHSLRFRLDCAIDSPEDLQKVLRNLDYLIAATMLLDQDSLELPGAHYSYAMTHIASTRASEEHDRERLRKLAGNYGGVVE